MKTAIILAAFGTRHKNAAVSLERIVGQVRQTYPEIPVRLAYTSRVIRGRMKKAGETVDSVGEALDALLQDGVTHVVIQSLHLIPGNEFHELVDLARQKTGNPGGFECVRVGSPLVADENDLTEVAEAIMAIADQDRKEKEAVLFMGHGTRHDNAVYYEALHDYFQQRDRTIHMGVMEHQEASSIDVFLERFKADGVTKVHLIPFLFGAGWHVAKDMIGDGEKSWKTRLEQAGIQCKPVLKGAGEYDRMVAIWLDHLADALSRLDRC